MRVGQGRSSAEQWGDLGGGPAVRPFTYRAMELSVSKFAANLGFLWSDHPLEKRIERAADAGFEAIELQWPYDVPAEVVGEICRNRNLSVVQLNSPRGDPSKAEAGTAALPGREVEFAASISDAVKYGRSVGAGAVHVMAGIVANLDYGECTKTFIANVTAAARRFPETRLLLEAVNRIDWPGYFLTSLEQVSGIIERINAPNVGMVFDAYHVARMGCDVFESVKENFAKIEHIQIASVPDRREPDHGDLDYAAFLKTVSELGYEGSIGLEYRPQADVETGLRRMQAIGVKLRTVRLPSASRR
jgi:hydroxypyruvate isomerase